MIGNLKGFSTARDVSVNGTELRFHFVDGSTVAGVFNLHMPPAEVADTLVKMANGILDQVWGRSESR